MLLYLEKRRPTLPCRILSAFIAFTFIFSLVLPPGYAQLIPASSAGGPQTLLNLPPPGAMVTPTAAFTPTLIKGLTIHPENPLEFDFIVEKGDNPPQGEEFNKESMKLVKYFLASLTVPEDQMWVNLSPYEKDRIISENLGATEMGKDMLAQDYILKQLTASLMYPENELGKKFWDRIYKKAHEQYGTTEIPVDTFNKVWIVPERAVVYEHGNSAFVVKSHLRVMLEEDYEAKQANQAEDLLRRSNDKAIGRRSPDIRPAVGSSGKVMLEEDYLADSGQRIADRDEGLTANRSALSAEIIREVILPEIEKEVNAGETFANLRQIYNSMILATWYKKNLRESLLGQVYVDKGKTRGVDLKDPQVNQKIYEQYLEAFKKGVYNYIKEDYDPATKEIIPRKYFSGGAVGLKESNLTTLYRLPARQQEEIISAFRDIGNTPGARFNKLEIKLYEIAEANNIPEDTMMEIVRGIENTAADEAQNLFVGESSVSSPVMVDGQTPAESFKSVGFKDDLVSMISGTLGLAFEVRRHFQDRRNINKDESIIQRVVWTLQGNENIREIKVAGEPVARVNRGTGEYSVIIAQDYSMVERKSGFSVGTILGVYKEAELIGSIFFLNGPITTMAVTDGKRIAHYAYDGEQFVTRSDVATDLGAPTGKDSPSALGGVYTEWPQLFQDYYLGHGRGVPGSQEAVLKTRYSGVLGEDGLVHGATGANFYEILVNNGFLTEIVSLEQAKILSLFAQGAGGSAFIMTEGGPRSPRDLSGEIPAVQVYLGNKDAVGKLSAYFEARKGEYASKELRPRFLPVLKKVEVASPFHTVKLEDFLRLEVLDMDERPDLIGAVMAVAQAAQKVGAMYVTGARATGQIDSGGAKQLAIDEQTDQLFMNALRPWIKEYYSEDLGHVVDFNGDGIRLRVMIDALDGSSRVRGNGGSGTIVNFRKFLPGIPLEEQTGKEIVASMIIAHGITPKLILAIEGTGVYEFILDEGTFYGARAIDLSQPKIRGKGLRIALGGERPAWPRGFSELVDQWIQQGAIPGYSGALVTDIWGAINHMLDGGHAIFSYPANKLRVKSELQAIAYLFKVAGGANLTYRHTDGKEAQGLTDLLDVALTPEPDPAKQQKAPSAFGDAQTIQEMRSTLAGSSPVVGEEELDEKRNEIISIFRKLNDAVGNVFSDDKLKEIGSKLKTIIEIDEFARWTLEYFEEFLQKGSVSEGFLASISYRPEVGTVLGESISGLKDILEKTTPAAEKQAIRNMIRDLAIGNAYFQEEWDEDPKLSLYVWIEDRARAEKRLSLTNTAGFQMVAGGQVHPDGYAAYEIINDFFANRSGPPRVTQQLIFEISKEFKMKTLSVFTTPRPPAPVLADGRRGEVLRAKILSTKLNTKESLKKQGMKIRQWLLDREAILDNAVEVAKFKDEEGDKASFSENGGIDASSPIRTSAELKNTLDFLRWQIGSVRTDSKLDREHERQIYYSSAWRIELSYDNFASHQTWVTLVDNQGHDRYTMRYFGSLALAKKESEIRKDLEQRIEQEIKKRFSPFILLMRKTTDEGGETNKGSSPVEETANRLINSLKLLNEQFLQEFPQLESDFSPERLKTLEMIVENMKSAMREVRSAGLEDGVIVNAIKDVLVNKIVVLATPVELGLEKDDLGDLRERFEAYLKEFQSFELIAERGELRNIKRYHGLGNFINLDKLPEGKEGTPSSPVAVSPSVAGRRNNVGTFLPLQQVRSEEDWGIGDWGVMKKAVDVHVALGQNIIQLLPFNLSSAGYSPYSLASSRLMDPNYINVESLMGEFKSAGISTAAAEAFIEENRPQIEALRESNKVDYAAVNRIKMTALKIIWDSFKDRREAPLYREFEQFQEMHQNWLPEHLLYVILKNKFMSEKSNGWDWRTWDEPLRDRNPETIKEAQDAHREQLAFDAFVQFVAYRQYAQLREYADRRNVEIMVDMPYALDGADIWLNPGVFGLKKENGYKALVKQGVPPEPAYPAGQYWQFFPFDWDHPDTVPFILERFRYLQGLASQVRLDHVLGYYRKYLFSEDVDGQMTLERLGLHEKIRSLQRAANSLGTEEARRDAVKEVRKLIVGALLEMRENLPEALKGHLPPDAIRLTMNEHGDIPDDNMLLIARRVADDRLTEELPEGSPWQREKYVVEKAVYQNQSRWDFLRLTPNEAAGDEGFLYDYFFPGDEGEVQPQDSLRLGYFELIPHAEAIMSEFLRLAQEQGTPLIWETLGVVPSQIQKSVERLGGTNYIPVIWGEVPRWGEKRNPYYPAHHIENAFAAFGLHDSTTMRNRWERELGRETKVKMLDGFFGKDRWTEEDVSALTPRVREKLLDMVYASRARIAVLTWIDLLGLGEEYRLNSPGEGGQWLNRLPREVTLENLLKAAKDEPAPEAAAEAVTLIRELTAKGARTAQTPGVELKIAHVTPEVGGEVIQIREVGQSFLVDAYVEGNPEKVILVLTEPDGNQERQIGLQRSDDNAAGERNGLPGRWRANVPAERLGQWDFYVEARGADGQRKRSGTGRLVTVAHGADLNPLSKGYVLSPASSPVGVGASEDADDTIGSMVEHSQAPGSLAPVKAKTQELPDYAVEKGKVEDRDPYKEIISDSRVPGFSPMVIQGAKKKVGGIDLNPALLDLQIKRDGNGVPLPLPQQPIENMHIEGFLPIIINVTPITNLPLLLGLADTEQDADETRPAMKAREPEEISSLTVPLSI